jgi:hypothetical protein
MSIDKRISSDNVERILIDNGRGMIDFEVRIFGCLHTSSGIT